MDKKDALQASFYLQKLGMSSIRPRNIFERYKNKERSAAMALSDLEILARLFSVKPAGEGENGMQAVASVIMNRVHITYGEYGRFNTIRESGISAKTICDVLWKR